MVSFYNKNNLFSLLVLGSLIAPFAPTAEGKSLLRRKTQTQGLILPVNNAPLEREDESEKCNAFAASRSIEDSFTFVLLEFENYNLNSAYVPNVNASEFINTYNSIATCPQNGAVRAILTANEFYDFEQVEAIKSTRAVFVNGNTPMEWEKNPKVLIRIRNFVCNACGLDEYKVFFDSSPPSGTMESYVPNLCDCRGPSPAAFVDALGMDNLKNATQIPLLHPTECNPAAETTFTRAGVCPGHKSPEFSSIYLELMSNSPSSSPTVVTAEPTRKPTRKPTGAPTSEPTSEPTRQPTKEPTDEPTDAPVAPTLAPVAPTLAPFLPTTAPAAPTIAPVAPNTALVAPTAAPITPMVTPITPTTAPIAPSAAPIAPTTPMVAPVTPTTAPIAPSAAPIAPITPTEAPATPTDAPVN